MSLQHTPEFIDHVLSIVTHRIYVYDVIEHRFVYISDALIHRLGYTQADLPTLDPHVIWATIHPDDRQRVIDAMYQVSETGQRRMGLEYRVVTSEEGSSWRSLSISPYDTKPDGRVWHIVGATLDITQHKQVEESLQQMNDQLQYQASLLDSLSDAVIATDAQFNVASWNKAAEQMYGWSASEVLNRPITDFLAASYPDGANPDDIMKAFMEQDSWKGEAIHQSRDGRYLPVLSSVTVLRDTNGDFAGALGIHRDISERKRTEEKLRFQANLLENVSDAVIATNADFEIVSWNKAAEQMYGWSASEIIGQHFSSLVKQTFEGGITLEDVTYQLREHGGWRGEIIQTCRNGHIINVLNSTTSLRDHEGKFSGVLTVNRDISERKQAEEALRLQAERLKILNEIDRAIIDAESSETLYTTVMDYLQQTLNTQRVSVSILDSGMVNVLAIDSDAENPITLPNTYPFYPEVTDELQNTQVTIYGDITTLPNPNERAQALIAQGVRSLIMATMTTQGQLIGALSASTRTVDAFTSEHADILREIANQLAIAIQQERLHQQMQLYTAGLEEEVARRTAELEAVMNAIPNYLWVIDNQHRFIYCNKKFAEMFNITDVNTVRGQSVWDLFSYDRAKRAVDENNWVLETGEIRHLQHTYNPPNTDIHLDTYRIPLRKPDGSIYAVLGASFDITPIMLLQQELAERTAELEAVMNAVPDHIWINDGSGDKYLYGNDGVAQTMGLQSAAEIRGKLQHELFPPEIAQMFLEENRKVIASGKTLHKTTPADLPDGSTRIYDTYLIPLRKTDGTIYKLLGTARDITPTIALQQQLTERTVQLESLFNAVPDYIWMVAKEGNKYIYRYANDNFAQALGFTSGVDIHGKTHVDLYSEAEAQILLAEDQAVFNSGKVSHRQFYRVLADGPHHLDTYMIPLRRPDGTVYAMLGTSRDITPIITLQQQLTERTVELETLMNAVPDHIWLTGIEGDNYLYCNDSFARGMNLKHRDDVRHKKHLDFFSSELAQQFIAENRQVLSSGEAMHKQESTPLPDGSTGTYDIFLVPLRKPDGAVYSMLGTARDITPLIQLQQQLSERTAELEVLMNTVPDYIWVVDDQHRFVYCNESYARDFNIPDRKTVRGRSVREFYSEEQAQRSIAENTQIFADGTGTHRQHIRDIGGQNHYMDTVKTPLRRPDGSVYAIIGTSRDVTSLLQLQQKLTERTTELEALMNAIPDQVWLVDGAGERYLYCNTRFAQLVGLEHPREAVGKTLFDVLPAEMAREFTAENKSVIAGGKTVQQLQTGDYPNGQSRFYDTFLIPLRKDDGTIYGMMGTSRDVTPMMTLQQQLTERTAELEALMNAIPDYVWLIDSTGEKYLYGNKHFAELMWLTHPDEVRNKTLQDLLPAEIAKEFIEENKKIIAEGQPFHKLQPSEGHDKQIHILDTFLIPLRKADSSVYALLGTSRDVTPMMTLQQQLTERTAELEGLMDAMPDYIWIMDAATQRYLYCNDAFLRVMGLNSIEDVAGKTEHELFAHDPKLAESYAELNAQVIKTGKLIHKLERAKTIPGERTLDVYLIPVKTPDGTVTRLIGTSRDITPMMTLQRELTERTAELEGVMNAVPDYIWMLDAETHRYRYCNEGFVRAAGLTRFRDVIGKNEFDLFPPELARAYADENERVIATGETYHKQETSKLAFGERTLDIYLVPLKRQDGTVSGLIGTARDITTLVELQEQLQQRTLELESLMNAVPDHIWMSDADNRYLYVNEAWARGLKLESPAAAHGKTPADFYPPDKSNYYVEASHSVLKKGEVLHVQDTTVLESGKSVTFDVYIVPLRKPDSTIYAQLGTAREITKLIELQDQLQERTTELESVMNAVPDHLWIIGKQDEYLYVNETYARWLGLGSAAEAHGKSHHDFYPKAEAEAYSASNRSTFRTGEIVHAQDNIVSRSGERRTFDTYIIPLRKADGTVYALLGTSRDVTPLMTLQRELTERTAELEVMNHELEAFSYSVSHDLRAPLRSIRGFTQAVLQSTATTLDESDRMLLQRAHDASVRLGVLIDDLLNLSQITTAEIRREPVDLSALTTTILHDLAQADPARQVRVSIKPGVLVNGDGSLLRAALVNLLENAWKFTLKTPDAAITFGSDDGKTFYVRDNGAGFDMTYANRLFRAFHRLHTTDEFPGTGIGLATVERIIHRHGGRIWAEAKPGEGATFYFTIGI